MSSLPEPLEQVITSLGKMPGIGRKTAQRMGFYLLDAGRDEVHVLVEALVDLKSKVGKCERCHYLAQGELCRICTDQKRDQSTVCVVERVVDVLIFERMGEYRGLYHVLGGILSPLDGITADDLNMADLFDRLPYIEELIIATHASIEGDTTALFISQHAEKYDVNVTRLARGLQVGANLEYTDEATLASAYSSRVKF
ncbi:recombination mediator RecR [Candidatus Neomarinimicrobiota bacterium]